MNYCRSEDCIREDLHAGGAGCRFPLKCKSSLVQRHVFLGGECRVETYRQRNALQDAILRHTFDYECRTSSQIHQDVINDYGTINVRIVQRALHELTERRDLLLVLPPRARSRFKRLDRASGAYIRYTSPLLFRVDGYENLVEQVDALICGRGGQ